jgi:hypothetical protein
MAFIFTFITHKLIDFICLNTFVRFSFVVYVFVFDILNVMQNLGVAFFNLCFDSFAQTSFFFTQNLTF